MWCVACVIAVSQHINHHGRQPLSSVEPTSGSYPAQEDQLVKGRGNMCCLAFTGAEHMNLLGYGVSARPVLRIDEFIRKHDGKGKADASHSMS